MLAGIAVAVVVLGLAARFLIPGVAGDALGGLLYAVLIYLLCLLVAPRIRVVTAAAIALAWCLGVEFLQLTSFPAQAAAAFWPSRLVLGSGFAWLDLLTAAAGVLAAAALDRVRPVGSSGHRRR